MSSIIASAFALTSAFTRFDRANEKLLGAVTGASDDDPAAAIGEQIEAKIAVKASVATVRIADEMFKALLEIDKHR